MRGGLPELACAVQLHRKLLLPQVGQSPQTDVLSHNMWVEAAAVTGRAGH